MSFAEPVLLAGFILLPLAMLAYGALQRRRRRESSAWANPALVPNLTTSRPGWRRHLPPLLLLLALAALVLALARPQRTVAAPQRAANIVMVTDVSGSMNAT
ncbi:MAG TPA: BatA domain-containing protein, partial [Solirubrobacter sp.]|nr:BatA domain-containing protein [Solirubrobacter sp.]